MIFNGRNICPNCFREVPSAGGCPHCGYRGGEDYPLALPAGTVLGGHYLLGRVLGQGGFGITYAAWDLAAGQKVAIKEFLPESLATRETSGTRVIPFSQSQEENYRFGKQQFLEEAGALSQFTGNPGIVSVYACFEENGTAYFTMEFLEGYTFKDHIRRCGGRVSWQDACNVLLPVMDALEAVHQAGMVHRDVTPDNIFLTREGRVKLLDFGAARYSLGDKSATLDVVLKHGFAPMEQYTAHGRRGPYTDIYALGACFYMALTGQIPPNALDRVNEDTLLPPEKLGASLPKEAGKAIMRALAVRAPQRQQTLRELRRQLTEQRTQPIPTTPGETRSRKGLVIGLSAAVAVLAIALAAALILPALNRDAGGRKEPAEDITIREDTPERVPQFPQNTPQTPAAPPETPETTAPAEPEPTPETTEPLLERDWLDGTYLGQAKGDIPHGEGTLTWDCGTWEGSFEEGYPVGSGVFTTSGGEELQGQWRWGTMTLTYTHGMARSLRAGSYEGLLLEDVPAGYGRADFDLAGSYTGGFREGNPQGQGTYVRRDGTSASGSWTWVVREEGSFCPEKKGTTTHYTGMILRGSSQGFGTLDFDSCGTFYGEFDRGDPNGSGAYYYRCPESHVYLTGDNWEFVYGDYRYENTYYGLKLNGTWQGFGIGILKSGNHYAGELLNDFRDGYGRVFLQNETVDPNLCGVFRRGDFQRKLN